MLEFEFRLCLRTFHVRNLLLKKKKKKALKKCWFSCAAFVSCKFRAVSCYLKFRNKFVRL